jgi:hypothetical protein
VTKTLSLCTTVTCVTVAGDSADYSDEVWLFETSTHGWQRVDNTEGNGDGPSSRFGHVMTSVGEDLWLHGGNEVSGEDLDVSSEGDGSATRVPLMLLLLCVSVEMMNSVCLCAVVTGTLTVCAVVSVRFLTCVTLVGSSSTLSTELWRFSTSTLGWYRVDNTVGNGVGPSARQRHVMTSVGENLWIHGGDTDSGEGDTC